MGASGRAISRRSGAIAAAIVIFQFVGRAVMYHHCAHNCPTSWTSSPSATGPGSLCSTQSPTWGSSRDCMPSARRGTRLSRIRDRSTDERNRSPQESGRDFQLSAVSSPQALSGPFRASNGGRIHSAQRYPSLVEYVCICNRRSLHGNWVSASVCGDAGKEIVRPNRRWRAKCGLYKFPDRHGTSDMVMRCIARSDFTSR